MLHHHDRIPIATAKKALLECQLLIWCNVLMAFMAIISSAPANKKPARQIIIQEVMLWSWSVLIDEFLSEHGITELTLKLRRPFAELKIQQLASFRQSNLFHSTLKNDYRQHVLKSRRLCQTDLWVQPCSHSLVPGRWKVLNSIVIWSVVHGAI